MESQKHSQTQMVGLVVPTTHWDRAWYWHNERYRIKLIELFSQLEDLWEKYPDYTFTLDGQTVALEDYLEVFPEKAELYKQLGREGRFKCGPLYVLSDMWLTGGESFIRNYLVGAEIAERFEARQEAVYQPDSFGFPPEMPMLITGVGSDVYITMRGVPVDKVGDERFFTWRAPDGSEVKVLRLRDGYSNAAALGLHDGTGEIMDKKSSGIHPVFSMDKAMAKLDGVFKRLCDGQGEPRLLLAGGDHRLPQPELPDVLKAYSNEERTLRFSDLDECADLTRKRDFSNAPVVEGELNEWSAHKLGGTVSTRIYLKAGNTAAEQALTKIAEPLDAAMALLGIKCPAGAAIKTAWKYLLKVHPHDDITGCGVDTVHREDETLIAHAFESAHGLRRHCMQALINKFGGQKADDERSGFVVFSSLGSKQVKRARMTIDFEGRFNYGDTQPPASNTYQIVDENGQSVQFREIRRGESTEHPHQFIELEISYTFRPFALTRFFFEEKQETPKSTPTVLENKHIRAKLNDNGSVDILHKKTGHEYSQCGLFSTQSDVGDEYTFAPIPGEEEVTLSDLTWSASAVAGTLNTIRISSELPVGDAKVPATVDYTLAPGEKHLTCRITFTNTGKDHRLRWNVPAPQGTMESRAGIHFAEVTRPTEEPRKLKNGLLELPVWPTNHFIAGEHGDAGMAVFTPFPMNYEIRPDSRMAITVCRSVGLLSMRERQLTNVPGSGPDTPTPEAQCPGRSFDFTFAIRPYAAKESGRIFSESFRWRTPLPYDVLWGANTDWDGTRMQPLLELPEDSPVVLSAFKQTHSRDDGLILRLFNPTPEQQSVCISHIEGELAEVKLDESVQASILLDSNKVELSPFELKSIRI